MSQPLSVWLAQTLMNRYPDPDDYPYRPWCYCQGFMLWGFIRLWEATSEQKYFDYVMRFCRQHVSDAGEVSGFTGESLDDIMSGSLLTWAYRQTGEEKYKLACRRIRRSMDDYPRNPDGGFWHSRDRAGEMWVDGLFMGLMFIARYGRYLSDDSALDEAVKQLSVVFDRCEKDGSGLLYHAYSEGAAAPWANRITGRSFEVWSEGLGWYAMALCEVLHLLPPEHPGSARLLMQLRKLVAGLAKVQDSTGLWLQVVDKPGHPRNFHDTSGSAMFLYAIQMSAKWGLLPPDTAAPIVAKGYAELCTKALPGADGACNIWGACNGLCVQNNYDAYVDYLRVVNAQEAVAAVLWASTAVEFTDKASSVG